MSAPFDDSALFRDLTLTHRAQAIVHRSLSKARALHRKSRARTSVLENLVLIVLAFALAVVTRIVDFRQHRRRSP